MLLLSLVWACGSEGRAPPVIVDAAPAPYTEALPARSCAAFQGDALLGPLGDALARWIPGQPATILLSQRPVWLAALPDGRVLAGVQGAPALALVETDGSVRSLDLFGGEALEPRQLLLAASAPESVWAPLRSGSSHTRALERRALTPGPPIGLAELGAGTPWVLGELDDGSFLVRGALSPVERVGADGRPLAMPDGPSLREPVSEGGPSGERWLSTSDAEGWGLARVRWAEPPRIVATVRLRGRPVQVVADAEGALVVTEAPAGGEGIPRVQRMDREGALVWTAPLVSQRPACVALGEDRIGVVQDAQAWLLDRSDGRELTHW